MEITYRTFEPRALPPLCTSKTAEFVNYDPARALKTKEIQQGIGERIEHVEGQGEFEDEVAFGNATEQTGHEDGDGQITEHGDGGRAADVSEELIGGVRGRRGIAFRTHQRDLRIFIIGKLPREKKENLR